MASKLYPIDYEDRTLTDDESLNREFYAEHARLAGELGLRNQTAMASDRLQKLQRPSITTPPLTDDELLIWRAFLPTSYRKEALVSYKFDLIPIHILHQMKEWRDQGIFDEFEIRTEERLNDPALFGIRGGRYWLLARWGAADDTLISFAEIKQTLRRRSLAWQRICGLLGLLGAIVGITCLHPLFHHQNPSFLMAGIGTLSCILMLNGWAASLEERQYGLWRLLKSEIDKSTVG